MNFFQHLIEVLIGLGILIAGSHFFIEATASTANKHKISPLITGLVLVGFATSLPEIFVGVEAAWFDKRTNIAVGNAIGSNIANIGLILGLTALLFTIKIHSSKTLLRLFKLMCFAMIPPFLLMYIGNDLIKIDAIILLLCLVISLFLLMKIAKNIPSNDPVNNQFSSELSEIQDKSAIQLALVMIIGLFLLLGGAWLLVDGAVKIAKQYGMSDLVIGLTIIAVGTSLPETAASIASLVKKKYDIALGNIIGSNMFNMLAVLSFPALIAPVYELEAETISRDFAVMIFLTAMFAVMLFYISKHEITRREGMVLLLFFVGYQFFIYQSTVGS
tara:strand:+ start:1628 stop:2620 length:993 start_codon:yes stop_codon:yes gene_type:complete